MSEHAATPGVFGKLPVRGDFVARGLPASFSDPWHSWLVRGLTAARVELAERFEAAYMAAPVWRFVIPSGACGPSPAAGVLLPSVDAAGRLFPLTLATVSPLIGPGLAASLPWFEALENAGRDALAHDLEVEAWLLGLAGLVPPLPLAAVTPGCMHVPLPQNGTLEAAIRPALTSLGAERAVLLWCAGSPFVRPCALVGQELPEGACFARLLSDPVRPVEGAP